MTDDEAKVRWRCCVVLIAVVPAAAIPHTDMCNTNAGFRDTVKEKQLSFHPVLPTTAAHASGATCVRVFQYSSCLQSIVIFLSFLEVYYLRFFNAAHFARVPILQG